MSAPGSDSEGDEFVDARDDISHSPEATGPVSVRPPALDVSLSLESLGAPPRPKALATPSKRHSQHDNPAVTSLIEVLGRTDSTDNLNKSSVRVLLTGADETTGRPPVEELQIKDLDHGRMVNVNEVEEGVSPSAMAGIVRSPVQHKSLAPVENASKLAKAKGWFKKIRNRHDSSSGSDEPSAEGSASDNASTSSQHSSRPANYTKVVLHNVTNPLCDGLYRHQDFNTLGGAVWAMQFSHDGRYLATGSQDGMVRVWAVANQNDDEITTTMTEAALESTSTSTAAAVTTTTTTTAATTAIPTSSSAGAGGGASAAATDTVTGGRPSRSGSVTSVFGSDGYFETNPCQVYEGHTLDVLDVGWSKSNFILSASRDKTVRLWHLSRPDVLAVFAHNDLVTSALFHPMHDELFVTTSFDKKIRLWNIREQRMLCVREAGSFVTACTISRDGRRVFCGLYDGHLMVFDLISEGGGQLQHITSIHVKSTRGKNSKGKKITGLDTTPDGSQVLVTSNDSRLRLYNMNDFSLACKFKGLLNESTRIKASFNEDGSVIVVGSENNCVYLFKTVSDYVPKTTFKKLGGTRKDRSESYECFLAQNDITLCALFAPTIAGLDSRQLRLVVGSFDGQLAVFSDR